MRLLLKNKTLPKAKGRIKRRVRIRKKVSGTAERPRLAVFRSGRHIYASLIDDVAGKTLLSTSSLKMETKAGRELASAVGQEIAKKCLEKNVKNVVFDRGGYVYHGRIKALAEAAREAGLVF